MELLLHQWEDWPELYRNTDKTEATEIVIIDSQMNYRGKLDTYEPPSPTYQCPLIYSIIITTLLFSVEKSRIEERERDHHDKKMEKSDRAVSGSSDPDLSSGRMRG